MRKDAHIALYYIRKAYTVGVLSKESNSARWKYPGKSIPCICIGNNNYYYDYGTALRCNVVIKKAKEVYAGSGPRISCSCLFQDGLVEFRERR